MAKWRFWVVVKMIHVNNVRWGGVDILPFWSLVSFSEAATIDKFDNIVNNIIIHIIAQLKWNLLMWNQTHKLILIKKLIIKTQNLKLVMVLEYQNIKTILRKAMLQIGLKKSLWLKKLKILGCVFVVDMYF